MNNKNTGETNIINSLHPLERKVLPALKHASTMNDIIEATRLKQVEVMRALHWLQNKNILKLKPELRELAVLTETGKLCIKKELPEKRLLKSLPSTIDRLKSVLSKEEIDVSLGLLKKSGAISLGAEIKALPNARQILENNEIENLLASLPKEASEISSELLKNLLNRGLIKKEVVKLWNFELTVLGKSLSAQNLKTNLVEALTPEMLQSGDWKHKKFRIYNIKSPVQSISPGKRHFINQAIREIKTIWLDMGFKEMSGSVLQSEFWNFDALFVPQDHPAREMQDTFFINRKTSVPEELVKKIKLAHEKGIAGSTGWQYAWNKSLAEKMLLRTHTTVLSAQTLAKLNLKELPRKFFAIGNNFRNEALDWSHLFEFHQTEGIVVDENVTFRDLLGYLREFFSKMGFTKIRFRPGYFPYTEPSVEVEVYHPVHKKWIELGGAGMFRPEVTAPLLGKSVPVLAWGLGLARIVALNYGFADIRDLYKNDLKQLREVKCRL